MIEAEPQIFQPMLALQNEETESVFSVSECQDYALVGACFMVPKEMLPGLTPRMIVDMFAEHLQSLAGDPDVAYDLHSSITGLGSN